MAIPAAAVGLIVKGVIAIGGTIVEAVKKSPEEEAQEQAIFERALIDRANSKYTTYEEVQRLTKQIGRAERETTFYKRNCELLSNKKLHYAGAFGGALLGFFMYRNLQKIENKIIIKKF